MYKIAVLGDRDSIYGFAALGLEVFPVPSGEEGARTLRRLSEQDYAVVYVTEALAAEMPAELERCRESLMPAVIPIPGVKANAGTEVGSDIIFNGN